MHSVDTDLVWWAFMIGMFSHLVMDSFTKEGVPWLLPIPIKFGFPPLKRLRVTTGKLGEAVFFLVILAFDAGGTARRITTKFCGCCISELYRRAHAKQRGEAA
jgi:membrane-bound metal-dependent hydrolase YbcI (DUF457 family)